MTTDPKADAISKARDAARARSGSGSAAGGKSKDEIFREAEQRIRMANSEWIEVRRGSDSRSGAVLVAGLAYASIGTLIPTFFFIFFLPQQAKKRQQKRQVEQRERASKVLGEEVLNSEDDVRCCAGTVVAPVFVRGSLLVLHHNSLFLVPLRPCRSCSRLPTPRANSKRGNSSSQRLSVSLRGAASFARFLISTLFCVPPLPSHRPIISFLSLEAGLWAGI